MKLQFQCLAAGLAMLLAPPVVAQTLEATLLRRDPAISSSGSYNGEPFHPALAGEIQFDAFAAFCVDTRQQANPGNTILYTIQDPSTLAEVGAVQRILGAYYGSDQTDVDAAAAQWAIWKVINDGTATPPSFSSGKVQLEDPGSAVAQRALDYLNNLENHPALPVRYLTSPERQDMITVIPEPAATALLAGVLGLLLRRRRR